MIALYLIAAHFAGDFVVQSRHQVVLKLRSRGMRLQHVLTYAVPFVPVAAFSARQPHRVYSACLFLAGLVVLHYLTDSYRFRSTLGDVVQWRLDYRRDPGACARTWTDYLLLEEGLTREAAAGTVSVDVRWPPPNPWPAMPLMIDQTLHICQLALLGGLLLR